MKIICDSGWDVKYAKYCAVCTVCEFSMFSVNYFRNLLLLGLGDFVERKPVISSLNEIAQFGRCTQSAANTLYETTLGEMATDDLVRIFC